MSRWERAQRALARSTTDTFGELVTFKPFGGTPRQIRVVVDRDPPARLMPDGALITPKLRITALNNPATGISAATVNGHGADKITIAVRQGGTPEDVGVYWAPGGIHDAGHIELDLR